MAIDATDNIEFNANIGSNVVSIKEGRLCFYYKSRYACS